MTIHVAEGPTSMAVRRSLARWNLELQRGGAAIRYGFSVICVALALGVALALQNFGFRGVESPVFDLAIVVTTWTRGLGLPRWQWCCPRPASITSSSSRF